MTSTSVVAALLPGGRLLIAVLDPAVPDHRSPLRYHLRHETPNGRRGRRGPGEGQPGQTPDRAPR